MAEKRANLILTLKDEASAGLNKIKGSAIAVGAAVAGLTAFLIDSVKSYMQSETAVNRLNSALKNQGIFTEQLSKEMQDYASDLQKTTTFSDEAILSTQTMLTTFGLAGAEMQKATQAALDLSTGLGIDLNTATMLIGKSFSGSTEALGRYGIKIDENLPKTQQFSAVLAQVQDKFGGRAQAEVETMAGKMANLANRWDDMKETIGAAVVPALERALGVLEYVIGGTEQLGGVFQTAFLIGLEVLSSFVSGIQAVIEAIPFLAEGLNLIGINFDEVNQKIQSQIDSILNVENQERMSNQRRLLNTQITTSQAKAIKDKQAAEDHAASQKRLAELKKNLDEEAQYNRQIQDQIAADTKKRTEFEFQMMNNRFLWTTQILSNIATFSNSKNKELAAIGKAAGIASATVDTYRGANLAMATLPPPWGIAMAASIVAAGLANVSRIMGVQLAQGGVVLPRMGGTLATIGESGRSEAVIPLGDERTNEKLRDSGLGTNITINVNAGVLVGGQDNMRELARMIDQELFSLRRHRESVAFEGL